MSFLRRSVRLCGGANRGRRRVLLVGWLQPTVETTAARRAGRRRASRMLLSAAELHGALASRSDAAADRFLAGIETGTLLRHLRSPNRETKQKEHVHQPHARLGRGKLARSNGSSSTLVIRFHYPSLVRTYFGYFRPLYGFVHHACPSLSIDRTHSLFNPLDSAFFVLRIPEHYVASRAPVASDVTRDTSDPAGEREPPAFCISRRYRRTSAGHRVLSQHRSTS